MSGIEDTQPAVPVLEEPVAAEAGEVPILLDSEPPPPPVLTEAQLAALQVELTSLTRELTDRLLDGAIRDMEATLLEKVSDQLREELPDLINRVLREHLEPGD